MSTSTTHFRGPHDAYSLHTPLSDTVIWRYMDLAKFVSMLKERGLFFASVATLAKIDKWEAAFPVEFLLAHERGSLTDPHGPAAKRQAVLSRTCINCWHENPQESAAMWKLYSSGAYTIAVKSTVQGLRDALSKWVVEIFSVDYIDYSKERKAWNNLDSPLFHKRKSFEHEKELRAVVQTPSPCPHDKAGLVIETNLSALLQEVYISPHDPPWLLDVVKSLLDKYGWGAVPVTNSALNEEPHSIRPHTP
jgi:hypothetical protein